MSKTKRFYENIVSTITEAIYEECFDMADCLESTKEDVEDSIWTAITSGDLDQVYDYIADCIADADRAMPKASAALQSIEMIKG